jgi:parallel beta-helix repeat protein
MMKWILPLLLFLVVTGTTGAIPNPSAVYCILQGYEYETRTDEQGNQYGVCVFPDGSECEAWNYYCKCEPNGITCWPGDFSCNWPCKQMRCKEAGESVLVSTCCEGLDEIYPAHIFDTNCNKLQLVGWLFLCSDCGNGICEDWESRCNCPADCAQPRIIYVDDDANGANDGSNWSDAFNDLQDALDFALPGDEIRVAQGIYKPGPPGPPGPPDPPPPPPPPYPMSLDNGAQAEETFIERTATFQLKNGVTIKGGYAGFGEPDPNARDIVLYETALTGDLASNDRAVNDPCDLLDDPCRAENSYHVVTGSGTDESAVLDGITITAGNANGSWSDRTNFGGGMFNVSSSPTITNCTFTKNLARDGGGMCNYDYSNPMLTNCTFRANLADRDGGGISNIYHSSPMLTDCTFRGNSAKYGGGMYNTRSRPTLTDCAFSGNSASSNGGGISNWFYSGPILSNCTFSENSAGSGGGFFSEYAPPPPVAGIDNGRIGESPDTPVFYNSGGANITKANCDTLGNSHGDHAGGMDEFGNHPMLTNCTFTANSANMGNGGGIYSSYGNPTLLNCVFSGNSAKYDGGGMSNFSSNPTLTNCTFSGNFADSGGGMYNTGGGLHSPSTSNPTLINCTFAANAAVTGRALCFKSYLHQSPSNTQIINCILWDGSDEIWNNDGSTIAVTYSDVDGGWPGEGNIVCEPLFIEPGIWVLRNDPNIVVEPNDPNAIWVEGDYHLLADSLCIDAGDPNYVAGPNETDLDGKPRVIGGRIDMGAYEYSPPIWAEVRIVPQTISLQSKGKWITAFIQMPEDYDMNDIDPNTVLLKNEIEAERFWLAENKQVAIAKFSREEIQPILEVGEVELTITGQLTDGTSFEGTDVIRVIDRGSRKASK